MKNYMCFINDHSGSMSGEKAEAARKDYNATILAVKEAASREMLDTVVSVVAIGLNDPKRGGTVLRQVVISNPHVLKPVEKWPTPGGTPLYDAIADMIALCEGLPDATDPDVSFVVQITTDGKDEYSRKESKFSVRDKIIRLQSTGRWTFTARTSKGDRYQFDGLGIPSDNIYEWDNSADGMREATIQTTQSINNYYVLRSAGAKASTAFYANAAKVDPAQLVDISNKVSLYVVDGPGVEEGIQIRDFILKKRTQYLKGSAFYQLTKTEARVAETKLIVIRDQNTGKIYGGKSARAMLGLPERGNVRLHPGDHKKYDIFVQSESVNRKLVKGTGVIYWEEIGVPFTQEELDRFLSPVPIPVALQVPPKPSVIQLPKVAPTNRPTPSPIPVTKQVQGAAVNGRPIRTYPTRDEARKAGKGRKGSVLDLRKQSAVTGISNERWAVYA